jgi:hypothetical protein
MAASEPKSIFTCGGGQVAFLLMVESKWRLYHPRRNAAPLPGSRPDS